MANMQPPQGGHSSDLTSPHTTFVQADPSNFRTIVQKLTGASDDPSSHKLPLTVPSRPTPKSPTTTTSAAAAGEMGPRKPPPFKLHERRHRKLDQIQLNHTNRSSYVVFSTDPHHRFPPSPSPSSSSSRPSPVSPLDLFARGSPRSTLPQSLLSPPPPPPPPPQHSEEEERSIIAEKGFYLHPSPRSVTPRGAAPELLPLFPLQSPRDNDRRS